MTALALPVRPLRKSSGFARPKSDRWAEGDALVTVGGRTFHARGLVAKLRGIGIDFLYGSAHEQAVLNATLAVTALTTVSAAFLALTTSAVANTDTSASLVEATYTGYTRKALAGLIGSASGSNPATIQNTSAITGSNCTAGSSIVIGYSITDTATIAGAGRNLVYGTCTSVTISATQTPPTVNTGGLVVTQT